MNKLFSIYRFLTGRKYTLPYNNQMRGIREGDGSKIFWKTIPKEHRNFDLVGKMPKCKFKTYAEYEHSLEVECRLLNWLNKYL